MRGALTFIAIPKTYHDKSLVAASCSSSASLACTSLVSGGLVSESGALRGYAARCDPHTSRVERSQAGKRSKMKSHCGTP